MVGRAGQGRVGQGQMGLGRAREGRVGSGRAGPGRVRVGPGRARLGRAGQGQERAGRVGQCRAGSGRADSQICFFCLPFITEAEPLSQFNFYPKRYLCQYHYKIKIVSLPISISAKESMSVNTHFVFVRVYYKVRGILLLRLTPLRNIRRFLPRQIISWK